MVFYKYMDSTMDYACLQARVQDLERDLSNLRLSYNSLVQEKNDIFYSWTKDDFVSMLSSCISDIDENYKVSDAIVNTFWAIWKTEFNENWSSHACHEQMTDLLRDILEKYSTRLYPSDTK